MSTDWLQKCVPCVQEIEDRVPNLTAAVEEERIRDEERRRMDTDSAVNSTTGSYFDSRSQSQVQSTNGDGIYIVSERGSTWGGESVRSPSPTNTEVSISKTVSHYSGSASGTRNGFAKQPAYRPPIRERIQNQVELENRQRRDAQMATNQDDYETDSSGEDPY
jgi:hypothetical protein